MSLFEIWSLFSEGSSTQIKTKLALIAFILWHLWESEKSALPFNSGKMSDMWKVYCQCAKSIVLAQNIV